MALEYLLYTGLGVFGIIIIWLSDRLYSKNKRIKQLEKWLYSNTTDFEKLSQIIGLYGKVDFSKLRPGEVELFFNWITKNIIYNENNNFDFFNGNEP